MFQATVASLAFQSFKHKCLTSTRRPNMERQSKVENHLHVSSGESRHFGSHPVFVPLAAPGSREGCHASQRRVSRMRMFCPTCNFESFLQRSNEEARCLKCDTLIRRRSTNGSIANFRSVHVDQLQPRGLSGEVNSYEQLMLGEWESGHCEQAPTGTHHWKFGKCQYCQKPEGETVHGSLRNGDIWCATGGKCSFKSASCSKCGRVKMRSSERRNSRHSIPLSPRPSSRQSRESRQDSTSPRPSPRQSTQHSLSPRPSSRQSMQSRLYSPSQRFDSRQPRQESVPPPPTSRQSRQESVSPQLSDIPMPSPRRDSLSSQPSQPSIADSHNDIYVNAGGRRVRGLGSFCNPGSFFGICSLGGKCLCKFGTCLKCGNVEGSLPSYAIRPNPTPAPCAENNGCDSVPVGGSLRAIRKLQQANSKLVNEEEEDQSTSAGSDDEQLMTNLPSNESRVSAL